MEMERSEQDLVVFPSEGEIKSYFPDEIWNNMSEYERKSYQNVLHNYNVMRFLDLKPVKPSFMTLYQKKTTKRKGSSKHVQVPPKLLKPSKGKPVRVAEVKQQQRKGSRNSNTQKTEKRNKKQKKAIFTQNHKWKSIQLQCVFTAVFKVYKRYYGIIKGIHLRKRKILKVSKKYSKTSEEKKQNKSDITADIVGQEVKDVCKIDNTVNDQMKVVDNTPDNTTISPKETNVSASAKEEGRAKSSKTLAVPQTKPVCRSVQTMTVAEGGSLTDSALVFVNAASHKKVSVGFPDPKPLTPQERKRAKKINKERMKTRRNVQTQTAAEISSIEEAGKRAKKINKERMKTRRNVQTQTAAEISSIEEADLVFFPMPKPKKPKPKPVPTHSDPSKKEELVDNENEPDKTVSDSDANDVIGGPSPPQQSDDGATVTTAGSEAVRDKTDDSSEDEFGFYAMFGGKNDKHTEKRSSPKIPPKPQPVDLAVPGCSFWPTPAIRTPPKSTSVESVEDSDEDEFGFAQLAKEAEAKAAAAAKPTPKNQRDTDSAMPGCSESLSGRRYPRRAVPTVDYTEAELLKDDEYLFCDFCDREYEGDCPEHGPHTIFPDSFVPVTGDDERAIQTTPAMLKVEKSKIPGAGSGVWTKYGVPPHVRFGPYEGDEASEPDPLGYSWGIVKDKRVHHYVAAHSTATSNWMRFVNCARHETEQNLMAFQYKGQMFYRTVKLIPPKAELFVWYGKEYAEMLGISMERFRSKDTSHLRNLVFPCNKCNVTYTSPLYLEAHGRRCRGGRAAVRVEPSQVPTDVQTLAVRVDGRKTFCCNLCSYKTTLCGNMKKHVVTHSGVRPHHCDVCGKGFTRASHLNTHKRIHTGDKPYKCTQCSYTCNDSSHLSKHMTRHTGEKVYACPQCDYKTAVSSHMEVHSRTHSGVKPYSCTLCQYSTAVSSHLTRHMRTHTGEKPYPCPHCEYRAAEKGTLNKHIASLHSTLQ